MNFLPPAKRKLLSVLINKASKELGREASTRDLIELGYLVRVKA